MKKFLIAFIIMVVYFIGATIGARVFPDFIGHIVYGLGLYAVIRISDME